jgi:transcription initiation factor TFIIB
MTAHRPQRERSREDTDEGSTTAPRACPECDGSLVANEDAGETVCGDCGLVVDADELDRGPEWRAFDASERDEKSRVGAPMTKLMHDEGLSTTIGWRDRDASGNALDARQRERMGRLRTWDERFRTRDARDRNLKHALGEIDRMASALGVPDPTRETAGVVYRRALDENLLPGRSIEGVATACLYAAARLEGIPRSIDEVSAVSRVGDTEIERTYRYVVRELDLTVAPTNPAEYLGRFASEVDCSGETERRARELVQTAVSEGVHSGKHPVGIAAAALYAAGRLTGESLTQSTISAAASVSEVTIRNRYRVVLAAADVDDAA